MRRTILLCLCGLLTSAALSAQAPASPPSPAAGEAHEAALRLVRTINLRPILEETVSRSLATVESREIMRFLLAEDKGLIEAYEAEAAALYEKRFSAQELRGLTDFFASDLGRKWTASQAELGREELALVQTGQGPVFKVAELGCQTAMLSANFVAAREKLGKPTMAVPADFLTRFAPIIPKVRDLCECVLKEAMKRWGPGAVLTRQKEVPALTQELVKAGVCHYLPGFAAPAPPKK